MPRSHSAVRGPVIALAALVSPEPGAAKWQQIAYEGAFHGHAGGEFELTREVFERAIANFRRHPSYRPGAEQAPPEAVDAGTYDVIPWDFHHASEQAPTSGTIPVAGAPAQGWVLELAIRNGPGKAELWALTRFLEPLRTYVREGRYRSCSMTFYPNAVDPVTGQDIGPYISSVAATNDPFLQGMAPLAASRDELAREPGASVRSEPVDAVGSDGLRRDSRMDLLKLLAERLKIPADPEGVQRAIVLRLEAGETATAGLSAVLAALGVEDVAGATKKIADMFRQCSELEKAMPELKALREQKAAAEEKEAEAEVDSAMQAHRMPQAARVAMLALRRANPEEFRKAYPVAPAAQAHLTQPVFTQPTQLQRGPAAPPPPPGAARGTIDLSAYSGRNVTEQALAYLDATDPNAKRLSRQERFARARVIVAQATGG